MLKFLAFETHHEPLFFCCCYYCCCCCCCGVCVCVFGVSNAKNLAFDTLDVSALRAFTSGIYKKKLFYHLKNYFIIYTIPFFNTPTILTFTLPFYTLK